VWPELWNLACEHSSMINSMTGYGEAQGEVDGMSYSVEVKAVNNRYLKAIIKLPELAAFLEEDIERLLREGYFGHYSFRYR